MSGGGKSGNGKIRVTRYYASLLLGVCLGKVTALRGVYLGERLLLGTNVTEPMVLNVSRDGLHGGIKKEGGGEGAIWFMPGGRRQVLPTTLANKFYPDDPANAPGYRGLCCIGLTEPRPGDANYPAAGGTILNYGKDTTLEDAGFGGFITSYGGQGFYVAANNPYLKAFWVEVLCASDNWFPERALIYRDPDDHAAYAAGATVASLRGKADSNFVHILYETLTDSDWGMGAPVWSMDDEAWRAAAQTCFDERLGGSFLWSEQMKIRDFAQFICDHIRAMMFDDPATGRTSIRLIRPDYNPATLPVLSPQNCDLIDVSTRDANEIVNEIVVKWTNPDTMGEESVYAQDLASIADVGQVISETHTYAAFCRQDLADEAASRDVLSRTAPMKTLTVQFPPSFPLVRPGDVFRCDFPADGIEGLVARVGQVKRGVPTTSSQEAVLIEDIFAEVAALQSDRSGASGVVTGQTVLPALSAQVVTMPYYVLRQAGVIYEDGDEYAGVLVSVGQNSAFGAELWANVTTPLGTSYENVADIGVSRAGALVAALPIAASSSNVALTLAGYGSSIDAGDFLVIGADMNTAEIALIEALGTSGYDLKRGVLDTVPRTWPAATPVWVIRQGTTISDGVARVAGATAAFGIRPTTFYGTLDAAGETYASAALVTRAEAPLRPSRVRIDGSAFGGADAPLLVGASFVVSWSNRNRITEDALILGWDDSTVTPETGQTTTLEVKDGGGATVVSQIGLTGTTYTVDTTGWAAGTYTLTLWSVRAGIPSFQKVQRQVYL